MNPLHLMPLARRAMAALAAFAACTGTSPSVRAQEALRVAEVVTGPERPVLAIIAAEGLDARNGFKLVARAYGGEADARRALMGGDVDVILTDWLWAARQRAKGEDVSCAPASVAPQEVMVATEGPVTAIADLVDRRVGVGHDAGNPTWVMIKAAALSASRINLDLTSRTFGPTPALATQLRAGNLDALVADWPEATMLRRYGFTPLIGTDDLARSFGVVGPVPTAVWAFRDATFTMRPSLIPAFMETSRAASRLLATDAKAWIRVRALYPGADDKALAALRGAFAAGAVPHWGVSDAARMDDLAKRLAKVLGAEIPGPLPPGLFRDELAY
jgi:NitT/TauT family transport system substrate-binding protein